MSSHKTEPNMEDQSVDAIGELIRWALLDEVTGEEPSPQVWQNIQSRVMTRSRAMPSQLGMNQSWRQFASVLQAWALGLVAPWDAKWSFALAPRERAYLIWRENLLLSMMPLAAVITY